MQDYEEQHTMEWMNNSQVLPSSSALPHAPIHLEKLLEEIEQRGLESVAQKTPPKKNALYKLQNVNRFFSKTRG